MRIINDQRPSNLIEIMKYSIFTAALFCVTTLNARAQEAIIPQEVISAFVDKYPHARNTVWEKVKENFVANWDSDTGYDNGAEFSRSGKIVRTTKLIPARALPTAALAYLN